MPDQPRSATSPRPTDACADAHAPIAIVGIGCRFPQGDGPRDFWRMLLAATDTIREIPPDRFDLATYFDPEPAVPGRTYSRWGGFLEDIDRSTPTSSASRRARPRASIRSSACCSRWRGRRCEDAGIAPAALAGSADRGVRRAVRSRLRDRRLFARRPTSSTPTRRPAAGASRPSGRLSYALGPPRAERVDRHGVLVVAGRGAPRLPEPAQRRVRRSPSPAASTSILQPRADDRVLAGAACSRPTAAASSPMRRPTGSCAAKASARRRSSALARRDRATATASTR